MQDKNRKFMCPKCKSTNLVSLAKDDFEREIKWHCGSCSSEFTTKSSDDSTDYFENK